MNDALESYDRKQSAGDRSSGNGAQDDQAQETSSVPPALALKEELGAGDLALSSHVEGKWEIEAGGSMYYRIGLMGVGGHWWWWW